MRRAELFTNLGIELTSADDIATIADVVRRLCDQLWAWQTFQFTLRKTKSSYQFRNVLAIETVDGERIESDGADMQQSDYSPAWGRVLDGKALLVNRARSADGQQPSTIIAPIRIKNHVMGALSLTSGPHNPFAEADVDLLLKIADSVGPTILRCRAEQRMQEFLRLGERLNQVVDTTGVARVVANTAMNLMGWDFISVHLYDAREQTLRLVLGLQRTGSENRVFQMDDTVHLPGDSRLAQLLESRGELVDGDGLTPQEMAELAPFSAELPLLPSVILCPIKSMNRLVGLLCIQHESPTAYGQEELEIGRGLSDYCGGALERAYAEQELKQSEENYRRLVENVNDGIVISQDDRFVFFNSRFAELLGYDTDELKTKLYTDIYTPEGVRILLDRARRREAGEEVPGRYETIFRRQNGESLPVEANVSIIDNFNGRNATFAVIRDISERRQAEAKLRQSEEELRTLFNAMTDIILVIDAEGRYIQHNSGSKQLLFTPWENLAGKSLSDVFTAEKAAYFQALIQRAVETGETLNIEYDHEWEPDDRKWYNASISPLSDHTVLMVARDVTERREAEEELFRSNARYKALLDGSEDYIFVLDTDLRFVHVNSAIGKRYGAAVSDRIGRTLEEIYAGHPEPPYIEKIREVFKTGKAITYDDDAVVRGRLICTETVVSPVFGRNGEVEAVLGVSRDVTSRRQYELDLRRSEQRYAIAVRGANDGIWDWNLENNTVYLSPRWWAIVGESDENHQDDYEPEVWLQRVHYADLLTLREKISAHIAGHSSHLEDEHRILHADGSYRWVLCRGICVRDDEDRPLQMAGSISDITDRKVAEEKLHYSASHDVLTDLPNRACFLDFLEKALARAHRLDRSQSHFAVLFLDLDRFKVINDSLGHVAGDELIINMARRLEACVRPGDTVARMGGDEFTVLLEGLNHRSDAARVAERIIRELSAPIQISGVSVTTTVSVGIAYDAPQYRHPTDLLRDADTAMYRAKAAGRNRYQVFDQQMHDSAMKQLRWETDLRRAVAMQEFEMYYQPVYKISTGRLSGFEGLIRWNHPERGLTGPAEFIPLAEETGLIVPLGWWIIDQAARAAAVWNSNRDDDDPLTISINLSPRQIALAGVASRISFIVANAGALPGQVIIEITENILLDDSESVAETLQELRDAGMKLNLDDFGTGFSSLSYLRRYPLDMLKIDRSFVSDVGDRGESREIVNAMLNLANSLGLQVTAEGVETREQYQALADMDCMYAQGFYFGRPMPFEQTLEVIQHRSMFEPEPTPS